MIRKFFSPTISPFFHSRVGSTYNKQRHLTNDGIFSAVDVKTGAKRNHTSAMENQVQSVVRHHLLFTSIVLGRFKFYKYPIVVLEMYICFFRIQDMLIFNYRVVLWPLNFGCKKKILCKVG